MGPASYGPSSYGDAFADVYDDWYPAGEDADAAVELVAALAGDGAVLELGVGTGRLAIPLAARGIAVHGIDASAPMLERLSAKPGGQAVTTTLADFTDVPVGGRFRVVLAACNALFNVPSAAAQARCLARAAAVLEPGGAVVVEGVVPDPDAPTGDVAVKTVAADHVVLQVTRLDHDRQTIRTQHVSISEGGVRLRPAFLRWAPPEELDAMAAAAGLALEHRWGGWRREPFSDDGGRHVSVYRPR